MLNIILFITYYRNTVGKILKLNVWIRTGHFFLKMGQEVLGVFI